MGSIVEPVKLISVDNVVNKIYAKIKRLEEAAAHNNNQTLQPSSSSGRADNPVDTSLSQQSLVGLMKQSQDCTMEETTMDSKDLIFRNELGVAELNDFKEEIKTDIETLVSTMQEKSNLSLIQSISRLRNSTTFWLSQNLQSTQKKSLRE